MLSIGSPQRTIRYRVDDWFHIGPVYDDNKELWELEQPWIRTRDLFAWIDHGNECVGAVEIHAYQGSTNLDEDWIVELFDSYSLYCLELGKTISSCWSEDPAVLFDYGEVIDLMHIWLEEPRFLNGIRDVLFDTFIPALTEQHSILISKAYPLEYEGEVPEGDPSKVGLNKRQQAMIRLAGQQIGVKPLPGEFGDNGWLWRANPKVARYIGKPKASA